MYGLFNKSKSLFHKGGSLKKPVKLGYGHMGNGLTVWDSNREEHGDYKKVAHISDNGEIITFYDKNLPLEVKGQIEDMASKEKEDYQKRNPPSMLTSYTDLKGGEKDTWLDRTFFQLMSGISSYVAQDIEKLPSAHGELIAKKDNTVVKLFGKVLMVIALPLTDSEVREYIADLYKKNIKNAIESGYYEKAITQGRMTAQDAKGIIQNANYEVPDSILSQVTNYKAGGNIGVGYSEAGYTIKKHKGQFVIDDVQQRLPFKEYNTLEEVGEAFNRYVARRKELSANPTGAPSQDSLIEADRFYKKGGSTGKQFQFIPYVKRSGDMLESNVMLSEQIYNSTLEEAIEKAKKMIEANPDIKEVKIVRIGKDTNHIKNVAYIFSDGTVEKYENGGTLDEYELLSRFEPTGNINDAVQAALEKEWFDRANRYIKNATPEQHEKAVKLITKLWNDYIGLDYALGLSDADLVAWNNAKEQQAFLEDELNLTPDEETVTPELDEDFFVSVDEEEPMSLKEFISVNTAPDVEPITAEEIESVKALGVGDSLHIGFSEVKRVDKQYKSGGNVQAAPSTVSAEYNEYGYVIYEHNGDSKTVLYKAGNSVRDSEDIVAVSNESMPLDDIKEYAEQVGTEFSTMQGKKYEGEKYVKSIPELKHKFEHGGKVAKKEKATKPKIKDENKTRMMTLISSRAKEIRAENTDLKWGDCIKKASAELKASNKI